MKVLVLESAQQHVDWVGSRSQQSSLASNICTCHIAGYQEVLFTCTREKSGGLPENITIDTVPEEVVPLLNRISTCSSSDDSGNIIIWYTIY